MYQAFVQTTFFGNGVVDVYCVDCQSSIGTMKNDTLIRAIVHNCHRGGVKCPQCRARSCAVCGVFPMGTKEFPIVNLGCDGQKRLCTLCEFTEVIELNRVPLRPTNDIPLLV